MTLKNIFQFGLILTLISACSTDPLEVDASSETVKSSFINLDSILIYSTPDHLLEEHHLLQKSIPEMYDYQIGYCMQIGKISDTAFVRSIEQFRQDKAIHRIEKRIHEKFGTLSVQKERILDGLKHLKFHFPNGKIPSSIVFMNSLLQSNAFCTEHEIGIGLERYLGKETDVIKELPNEPFYDWIKEGMNADYLERDAICSWIMTHYVDETDGNLAENIIRWGKIIYLTEAAFPTVDKHIIIRYSKEDYEWAIDNEFAFWKHLVDDKLLFKINELDRANMLNEAPFTIGLSEKSPDRFGQFLGWQMVKNYMSKSGITIEELVKVPYNTILQEYEIED